MSGFVGLVNLDGAPVDDRLLRRMTRSMVSRGPDRQAIWHEGMAGLGHALLSTTDEPVADRQPMALDNRVWIVADARIDARQDLVAALVAKGEPLVPNATDAELILQAYRAWGDECAAHLLGDFAFAIWDGPRRRLFAARDHLGVKPFYYAMTGRTLLVSNTLDVVRMHPGVIDRLNDLAVADFLLFETNQDPRTTIFSAVDRLPPAHAAVWSADGCRVRRYWTLPIDEPVFYRRASDYVDRFNEVIDAAVTDRLRTERVGIFMSGGIDSPALAAVASRSFARRDQPNGVRAFTTTVDGFDGNEGHYARLVATHLGIPISMREGGAAGFDPEWHVRRVHTPEPVCDVTRLATDWQAYQQVSRHSRVAFYGEGPDNALQYEWQPYVRYLSGKNRYGRLAGDVVRHVRYHGRLPQMSLIARRLRARRDRDRWDVPYPQWLNPALESRLKLRDRWGQVQNPQAPEIVHPVRPAAYFSFCGPEWETLFRGFDAETTGAALEVRHPYVDIRVLRYLLSVPPVPWCRSKLLIRRAMDTALPKAVLARRKSGMTADPDYDMATRAGLPPLMPARSFGDYVDAERLPDATASSPVAFRTDFRPRALNYWLTNLSEVSEYVNEEKEYDTALT